MSKNKSQMQEELNELQSQKEALLKAKKENPTGFTKEQQEKLSEVTGKVVDLEEQIEAATKSETQEKKATQKPESKSGYVPKPGTENLVHLLIVSGRRFEENTGEELSKPYIQTFSYGEYLNFKKNANLIGYKIDKVLYNPFKED